MPSKQKQHLRQQAVLRADAFHKAHKVEVKQKEALKATETPVLPLVPDLSPARAQSVCNSQPRKIAAPQAPLQDVNPNIRKLPGATNGKEVITESHNFQKCLARKKRARHIPLRSTGAKVEVKHMPVNMPEHVASSVTPIDEPSQHISTFAPVQEISFDPSEGTDVPELVTSQSPTSSESSLSSLEGFSGDFAFAAPQYTPTSTADWKAPGMFKMPAASALREEPAPSLCFTAGSSPTFAFEAPQPLPQLATAITEAIPGSDEQTRFDLATAVWAPASHTEPSSTDNLLLTVEAPQSLDDLQSKEPISISGSLVSSAAQVDGLEFLAMTYPDIYTAALGRPKDILTPRIVALGRATALAAYNEEVQRSYARAKPNLEGVHMSMEDFDLDSELDEAFEVETGACDDERIDTPSSELSRVSLLSGNDSSENSSNQVWSHQEHHQVFVTCEDGRCCVVSNTKSPYDVEEPNERDSAFESISSTTEYQTLLLEGINDPPTLFLEGTSGSGEQIASQGEGAAVRAPFAIDNSRFAALITDEVARGSPGASQEWLTLNTPSIPGSVSCSEKLTASTDDQHFLTLTSSFIGLPSEVSNYPSNIDQSSSVGRNPASMANQSPAPDHTSSESISSSSSSADDASTLEDQSPAPAVFPDWTVELVQVRLETESLFTFLSLLDANEEEATTKVALIRAFLTLIAAEREKLELPALPSTCTATSVLISKILPHTIVLGTTSLATFLAHFDFNEDDMVEAEEIYRAFKNLCKKEMRKNLLATTGITGKIGRRLGKLSSV